MVKTILKQSWQLIWRHPLLWLFGFFSALVLGNETSLLINNFNRLSLNLNSLLGAKIVGQTTIDLEILKSLFNRLFSPNFIFILLPLLILFSLSIIAQIGLIKGVKNLRTGKDIFLGQLFQAAWPHFGPVLLLNLVNFVIIYLLSLIVSLPLIHLFLKSGYLVWFVVYTILNLIILIPLSIVVVFIVRFAIINQVINQDNILISLKKSSAFFAQNWLKSVWLAIILAVIGLGVGLCLFVLIITAFMPFLVLSNLFYQFKLLLGFWLILSLGLLVVVCLIFWLGSLFTAFQNVVWTLFYLGKKSE